MESYTIDRIKHVLNTDVVRRLLVKYFREKGFTESFDRLLYPTQMQDLIQRVPVLASKLEVVPHAVELDPIAGRAVLGWNLFVLGSHRMYLGETHHHDLMSLSQQLRQGQIVMGEDLGTARKMATPRQVVQFITRVLGRHQSGYVDLTPPKQPMSSLGRGPGMSSSFYGRSGYG